MNITQIQDAIFALPDKDKQAILLSTARQERHRHLSGGHMRKLRPGDIVRIRKSPTVLSEHRYLVSNPDIKGVGGLEDIPNPAHLVLLVHSMQSVLAYYSECELVG